MTSIGTTSLNQLPNKTGTDSHVQLITTEQSNNSHQFASQSQLPSTNYSEVASQHIKRPNMNAQIDPTKFMNEIKKASTNGLTTLPSRDIPLNTGQNMDKQIPVNYIPEKSNIDYISENQSNQEIIKRQLADQKNIQIVDDIYTEFSLPIIAGLLFFISQLPVVKVALLKYVPFCYSKAGEINLTGYLFTSVLFIAILYGCTKAIKYIE